MRYGRKKGGEAKGKAKEVVNQPQEQQQSWRAPMKTQNGPASGANKQPYYHQHQYTNSNRKRTNSTSVSKGSLPDKYLSVGEKDVVKFQDYNHVSLDLENGGRGKKMWARGQQMPRVDFNSEIIGESEKPPKVKVLEKGFDFDKNVKPWCCFGNSWNARRCAQELSSGISSQIISNGCEEHVDKADFIGDWKTVKALLRSHGSGTHLSLLIHRIGNCVALDQLDVFELTHFPNHLNLPQQFKDFVSEIVEPNKDKIKGEGRSNKEIFAKEAYHKLLHCSMDKSLKVADKDQFLHRLTFSTDKFKFLVGCDTPVFLNAKKNEETGENVTVRARDAGVKTGFESQEALDIWLDNKLLQSSKTLLTTHADYKVTKTEWVRNDELPASGRFNPSEYLQSADALLAMISENVKSGETYWLYRAPGSYEVTLYNLSNIQLKSQSKSSTPRKASPLSEHQPLMGNWESVSPFTPHFASAALIKYAECISEASCEKLIADIFLSPSAGLEIGFNSKKPSKPDCSPKMAKIREKLESQVKVVKRFVKSGQDWMIEKIEEIRCDNFYLLLQCVEKSYVNSSQGTPTIKNWLCHHGVDRYYPTCLKLWRALISANEKIKFWAEDDNCRNWIFQLVTGIYKLLGIVAGFHTEIVIVDGNGMDEDQLTEWLYLGSRIRELQGDALSSLLSKTFKSERQLRNAHFIFSPENSQDISEQLLVTSYYSNAIELFPKKDQPFKVRPCFVPPTMTNVIVGWEVLNELRRKRATSQLTLACFRIRDPEYQKLLKNRPNMVNKTDLIIKPELHRITNMSIIDAPIVAKTYYNEIMQTLADCVDFLPKPEDIKEAKMSDEIDLHIREMAATIQGQMLTTTMLMDSVNLELHYSTLESLKRNIEMNYLDVMPIPFTFVNIGYKNFKNLAANYKHLSQNDSRVMNEILFLNICHTDFISKALACKPQIEMNTKSLTYDSFATNQDSEQLKITKELTSSNEKYNKIRKAIMQERLLKNGKLNFT